MTHLWPVPLVPLETTPRAREAPLVLRVQLACIRRVANLSVRFVNVVNSLRIPECLHVRLAPLEPTVSLVRPLRYHVLPDIIPLHLAKGCAFLANREPMPLLKARSPVLHVPPVSTAAVLQLQRVSSVMLAGSPTALALWSVMTVPRVNTPSTPVLRAVQAVLQAQLSPWLAKQAVWTVWQAPSAPLLVRWLVLLVRLDSTLTWLRKPLAMLAPMEPSSLRLEGPIATIVWKAST